MCLFDIFLIGILKFETLPMDISYITGRYSMCKICDGYNFFMDTGFLSLVRDTFGPRTSLDGTE